MTDKPIIINGCDASRCDFYGKNKKYCLTLKMDTIGFKNPSCFSGDFQKCIKDSKTCSYTFCNNNPNCYFKQLARKTQDEQKLKRDNRTMLDFLEAYYVNGENEGTFDRIEEIIKQVKGQK